MASSFFLTLRSLNEGSGLRQVLGAGLPLLFGGLWCGWFFGAEVSLSVHSVQASAQRGPHGAVEVLASFRPEDAQQLRPGQTASLLGGTGRLASIAPTQDAERMRLTFLEEPAPLQAGAAWQPVEVHVVVAQGSPARITWESLRRGGRF